MSDFVAAAAKNWRTTLSGVGAALAAVGVLITDFAHIAQQASAAPDVIGAAAALTAAGPTLADHLTALVAAFGLISVAVGLVAAKDGVVAGVPSSPTIANGGPGVVAFPVKK